MRVETRARSRVLQALYAWDVRRDSSLRDVAQQLWDDMRVTEEERTFGKPLIEVLSDAGGELDTLLQQVTENWRLERLGTVERAVLRLGAAELRTGVTPPAVVIQEAVRLAERYGSKHSGRFVNGVLDALARRMQLLQ